MKHWLLGIALICLCTAARAQTVIVPTTCLKLAISTSAPTEVTGNASTIATSSAVWSVMVMNLDTSASIFCSNDAAVSSTASSAHYGVPILAQPSASSPFNFMGWVIGMLEPWYCVSAGASSTQAQVCRWH